MLQTAEALLIQEQISPTIRVIRFVKPDLRSTLDSMTTDDTPLYREILNALHDLPDESHVIFNFGITERFPTSFFQVMMRIRQLIQARGGRVYLCSFQPDIRNSVELMGGSRLFIMTPSEQSAIDKARRTECS